MLLLAQCKPPQTISSSAAAPPGSLELVFTYSSEKKSWIEPLVTQFNADQHKDAEGKAIFVSAFPMGSGDGVREILDGKRQTHIISPASDAFLKLANAESQAREGRALVTESTSLVLSPVVLAMWKPMAEALGWPAKKLGWKDLHQLATAGGGWAAFGNPQWGAFRFGHTHPEYSNSGLAMLLGQVYASRGKVRQLTLADLEAPGVGAELEAIEKAVVHYGESTGFFGTKLTENGPTYLSAAVLYENMVVQANQSGKATQPLVAIYPKEGSFWADHPAALVDRPYVTAAHKAAGKQFIRWLIEKPQQEKAMEQGFRPVDPSIALQTPLTAANGVDVKEPSTILETPEPSVIQKALELWKAKKKTAHVVLVMDVSGSMKDEGKLEAAKQGAVTMIEMLGQRDRFSLLIFSSDNAWLMQNQPIATARSTAIAKVKSLIPQGGTALYTATQVAQDYLRSQPDSGSIQAIVVLTDGADSSSDRDARYTRLMSRLNQNAETNQPRIFTIGYGKEAEVDILESMSTATKGRAFTSNPENILRVFRDISLFF